MITRLQIQHYRSIEDLDLQLGNVTVFVGKNGAGKTNIIDAIKFVRDAISDGLDQAFASRNGIQNVRQWSPTKPYNMTINVEMIVDDGIFKGNSTYGFTISSTKENFAVSREELSWQGGHSLGRSQNDFSKDSNKFVRDKDGTVTIQRKINDESLPQEILEIADDELCTPLLRTILGMPIERQIRNFESYTIFPNTLREPQKQSNAEYLLPHGQNLTSIIKRMRIKKKSEAIGEIIAYMRQIVPDLENITTKAASSYIFPMFRVKPKGSKSHTFDVDQMSDGTLRILGLLVALYQEPGPSVIALEEPELTVHPGILQLLAEAIKDVGTRRQILVTTHSPELLDHFEPGQIIAVKHEDGVTKARPLNAAQKRAVKEDLFSLGELMSIQGLHG